MRKSLPSQKFRVDRVRIVAQFNRATETAERKPYRKTRSPFYARTRQHCHGFGPDCIQAEIGLLRRQSQIARFLVKKKAYRESSRENGRRNSVCREKDNQKIHLKKKT